MNKPDNTDMIQIAPNIRTNAAGLAWLEKHRQQPKDPNAAIRCDRYNWVCPFMQRGKHPPCQYKGNGGLRKHKRNLAFIGYEIGIPHSEPIGQMSLFEPQKTHETIWRHWKNGEAVEPYSVAHVDIVCKPMALAALAVQRKFQRRGDKKPQNWKVLPLDDDLQWSEEQAQRSNLKPCWFQSL